MTMSVVYTQSPSNPFKYIPKWHFLWFFPSIQGIPHLRKTSFRIPQGPQNPSFTWDFDQIECQFTSPQHRYFTLVDVFINKS